MNFTTFLPWALTTAAITLGAWIWIVQYERIQRRRALEADARADEVEAARQQVAQLENRVEFAERLLEEDLRKPETRR